MIKGLCFFKSLTVIPFFSLQVVSTRVGGVPEVLPDDLIILAEPSVKCKYHLNLNIFNSQTPPGSHGFYLHLS